MLWNEMVHAAAETVVDLENSVGEVKPRSAVDQTFSSGRAAKEERPPLQVPGQGQRVRC